MIHDRRHVLLVYLLPRVTHCLTCATLRGNQQQLGSCLWNYGIKLLR